MSSILFFVFLAPITAVWHPDCTRAEPGTYAVVVCEQQTGRHYDAELTGPRKF
jgi:hypothetical protein